MTQEEESRYEDADALRKALANLRGRKFRLDCGHYAETSQSTTAGRSSSSALSAGTDGRHEKGGESDERRFFR